jgi:hypothetical protein
VTVIGLDGNVIDVAILGPSSVIVSIDNVHEKCSKTELRKNVENPVCLQANVFDICLTYGWLTSVHDYSILKLCGVTGRLNGLLRIDRWEKLVRLTRIL